MNNKERYLKFIKDFKEINISNILKGLKMNTASFYTERYSLENMQKITDEFRKRLCEFYPVLNNNFELDTKEKNISFVKDIKEVGINRICDDLKIKTSAVYTYRCSDSKYEEIVKEIIARLEKTFNKYK